MANDDDAWKTTEPQTHQEYGIFAETWEVGTYDQPIRVGIIDASWGSGDLEYWQKRCADNIATRTNKPFTMGNGEDAGKKLAYRNFRLLSRTVTTTATDWADVAPASLSR